MCIIDKLQNSGDIGLRIFTPLPSTLFKITRFLWSRLIIKKWLKILIKMSILLSSLQLFFCRKLDIGIVIRRWLANFWKALYFKRWKTWMLHTLYIDASCYEVSSVTCQMSLTSFSWFSDHLKKKFKFFVMLNSLLL